MNPKIHKFDAPDAPFPFANIAHRTMLVRTAQAMLRALLSDVHARFLSAKTQGINGHRLGGRRFPDNVEA